MNKKGHVLNAVLLSIGLGYLLEPAVDLATLAALMTTFKTIVMIAVPVTLGALFPDVDTAFGKHRKTFHNLLVLVAFVAFPYVFGNLEYVWVGVLTHYILDVAGSKRGIALFYPFSSQEFGLPIGVTVDSKRADLMMVGVTIGELVLAGMIVFQIPQWGFTMGRNLLGI